MNVFIGVLVLAAGALALAGCGEKSQTVSARKSDMAAWQGTANTARAETGWTAGDRESWALHMQKRAQDQNEYTRTSVPAGSSALASVAPAPAPPPASAP